MIAVVWQFEGKPEKEAEFQRFFGADGPWTAVARRSRSYLGSSFLQDRVVTTRYLLIEYWSEMVVYERHLADFRDDIAKLDRERDGLVSAQRPLGLFSALDVPSRTGPTWSRRRGQS